jgi:hypothetical protein
MLIKISSLLLDGLHAQEQTRPHTCNWRARKATTNTTNREQRDTITTVTALQPKPHTPENPKV